MPLAGQIIRANDFGAYEDTSDTTDETNFNATAFTLGATTVGLTFAAPTSGAVMVIWQARGRLNSTTGERILVSAEVRTGSSLGAGTVVSAASDGSAIEWGQATNDRLQASMVRTVSGLTAGSPYNVTMWHRNAISVASAGSLFDRAINVIPIIN